jgi:hypothetical protein
LFPDLSFFPQEEKESTIALSSRVAETTRKKKIKKKNTHSGGSLVSFSFLLLFSRERRSAFSLSLSLSLSAPERREEEKNFFLLARLVFSHARFI